MIELNMMFLIVITIVVIYFVWRLFFRQSERDDSGYKEGWFGKDPRPLQTDGYVDDTSIRAFKIQIPEEVLTDLKSRLEKTRFEDPLVGAKFHYGFNTTYLRTVVDYWKTQYNWRTQEEMLNQFPHFKTRIEGIDIHFMHIKPTLLEGRNLKVLPLMIIHGWPGSVVEFCKIIPLLTTPQPDRDFVFEVICPSIPGYGFSESPHREGFNGRVAARVFLTLMERIGHPKFYAQGGDWGSHIASILAKYYPHRIIGLHLNMYSMRTTSWDTAKLILVAFFPSLVSRVEYESLYPLKKKLKSLLQETGYLHMQATKPDTLGCSMSDSPTGMAAYILEKFGSWTLKDASLNLVDGGITQKFTLDELLTFVMMYWVNNNFTAAARFYKENFRDFSQHDKYPVTVPSGVALFPNEIISMPKMLMSQQMKNLVLHTIMPRGGHFAAFEEPQLLADDIWKFAGIVEKIDP